MRIKVRLGQEFAENLRKALEDNFWRRFFAWEQSLSKKGDPRRFRVVGRFGSLRVEIRSDEHAPPHFHIISDRQGASYAIATCERIAGKLEVNERLVRKWWDEYKGNLVQTWNETRPASCPVGAMAMPAGWAPKTSENTKKKRRAKKATRRNAARVCAS